MIKSPATPPKGGGITLTKFSNSSTSAKKSTCVPSSHELTFAGQDPSPASTYGDSATDENVPATPLDVLVSAKRPHRYVASLSASKNGEQYSPSTSKSPVYIVDHDNSFTTLIEKLGIARISDDKPQAVISRKDLRPPNTFVLQGTESLIDDPFTTKHSSTSFAKQIQTTPTRKENSSNTTPTKKKSSSSSSSPGSARVLSAERNSLQRERSSTLSPFSPREDRLGQKPTVDNAQAIFPPDACVFVANLSSVHTDEQLEEAVHQKFSQFGTVYVKIRRDTKGMPYAFCQYETKRAADTAIVKGKGEMILGRKCRTEIAKVQRALYVSKHNGERFDQSDATKLLSPFGAIESVFTPSETERELYHLPQGFWIRFAYFQDCRDAYTRLRDHPEFRFDQHQEPFRQLGSIGHGQFSRISQSPNTHGYYASQDLNPAIFVGNLPLSVSQQDLTSRFGIYGNIMSLQIIRKPSQNDEKNQMYAFIEYLNPGAACAAIANENNRLIIHGHKIRVERKDFRSVRAPPHTGDQQTTLFNHYLAPHNNHLRFFSAHCIQPAATIYQDGLASTIPPGMNLAMMHPNSAEMVANVARTLSGNQSHILQHQTMYSPSPNGYYGSEYGNMGNSNTFASDLLLQGDQTPNRRFGPVLAADSDMRFQAQGPTGVTMPFQYRDTPSSINIGPQVTAKNNVPSPSLSSTASHTSGAPLNIARDFYTYGQAPGHYVYATQQSSVSDDNAP